MVEAAPEDLGLKHGLFARLESVARRTRCWPPDLLALGDAIAAEAARPERICGMHFFNPPTLMKLVELVAGRSTSEPALIAATRRSRADGPSR